MKLEQVADVIRSKNAGPLYLTFDIIFKSRKDFDHIKQKNIINKKIVSKLYKLDQEDIEIIYYSPANAIKITIPREVNSGELTDTDIFGTQYHTPLAELTF